MRNIRKKFLNFAEMFQKFKSGANAHINTYIITAHSFTIFGVVYEWALLIYVKT